MRIPITGIMTTAGIDPAFIELKEGENIATYLTRLFPAFLEILEGIWGPIDADAKR